MSFPVPVYQISSVQKQHDNDLQIMPAKIHGDIGISQLNIQPAKTCTGKPLAS